jgi:predicted naringenin-chalcone synthase
MARPAVDPSAKETPVALTALGTALPPFRLSQQESLEYILKNFRVRESTKALYKRVFRNESVRTRHFAFDHPDEVLETDHDRVHARFEKWGVRLSTESLRNALARAGVSPRDVDFLAVTTCTGYLCPGLGAYVVESAGLRPDTQTVDLVGMGCGAAVPALKLAADFVRSRPDGVAAVVCTEICSAAMYSDDAVDLVVSNAIFGDGSAAAILRRQEPEDRGDGRRAPVLAGFASLLVPEWRDNLRFRTEKGRLRNVLGKEVPQQAAESVRRLLPALLSPLGLRASDVSRWILHAGGEKILNALETVLGLGPEALTASRTVLRDHGNMSSPTVLFVLDEMLKEKSCQPGEWGVLSSFGAGFSAHGALLRF